MLTTLLALCFAVALAIGYALIASRFDEASVGRRQVDTWAVLAAFACLLFMGTGAADASREATIRRGQVARVRAEQSALPPLAVRHRRPTLRLANSIPVAGSFDDSTAPGIAAGSPASGAPESAVALDPGAGPRPASLPGIYREAPSVRNANEPAGVVTGPEADAAAAATAPAGVPWLPPLRGGWPVPTPRLMVYASPTPTRLPIEPLPPTPPPPTEPIQALPTPTPHCGAPESINVALQIERAEAERQDDELLVRYTAAFVNRSSFPVTVADLSVTALSGSSGSELYGHEVKPDMILPPNDRIVFEGAVKLDKAPSPFGTTELCIAFVGETCGRRQPYEVQRRCITVRGF